LAAVYDPSTTPPVQRSIRDNVRLRGDHPSAHPIAFAALLNDYRGIVQCDSYSCQKAHLGNYREQTGAERALLVPMTAGKILNA
jgi:hypothetical protein